MISVSPSHLQTAQDDKVAAWARETSEILACWLNKRAAGEGGYERRI